MGGANSLLLNDQSKCNQSEYMGSVNKNPKSKRIKFVSYGKKFLKIVHKPRKSDIVSF